MPQSLLIKIYYSAALVNTLGVLLFTKGLTNQSLMQTDPSLFSHIGIVLIMVWGLCYYACAKAAMHYSSISIVFAIEKLVYVCAWVLFVQAAPDWSNLYAQDLLTGLFYSIYGIVDALYMMFFAYTAYYVFTKHSPDSVE